MATTFRIVPHSSIVGREVVEVWHDGRFIATIAGKDEPGFNIFSKYEKFTQTIDPMVVGVVIEVPR